jgi:hypothetical protein
MAFCLYIICFQSQEVQLSDKTVTAWVLFACEVCTLATDQVYELEKGIWGTGACEIVEWDESVIGYKRKYNKGKRTRAEKHWVAGCHIIFFIR